MPPSKHDGAYISWLDKKTSTIKKNIHPVTPRLCNLTRNGEVEQQGAGADSERGADLHEARFWVEVNQGGGCVAL